MPNGPTQGPLAVVPGSGWVDLLSRVIVQVGFPVVVAGILLYYVLFKFQANMDMVTSRMAANTDVAAKLIAAESDTMKELQRQTGELSAQTQFLKTMADRSGRILEIQEER